MSKYPKRPDDFLRRAAVMYEDKNEEYGDDYKRFGTVMAARFPEGLTLKTAEDWRRVAVLLWMESKLSRYCTNFEKGGHPDSLLDLATYAAMMHDLDVSDFDEECRERFGLTVKSSHEYGTVLGGKPRK